MSTPPPSSPFKGILAGVGAAGVLSAFALVGYSIKVQATPCSSDSVTECAFEDVTRGEQAQLMRLAAVGLSTVGVGCLWWLRSVNKSPKAP